jgi:methionyl-tRNA formyltransferase
MQPVKVRSGEFPAAFEALGLDVAVVVAYGRILTRRLLAAPRLGCVNVHASLLPRWRGAAPIQWSIVAGDAVTGVTTMQMAEGLDTGDILLVDRTPITPDDTAGTLHDRLAPMGARLLVRTLAEWGSLVPIRQDDAAATLAPILERSHGVLDWTRPGAALDCQVRGLSPWPGTHTLFRGEALKVGKVGGFRPSAASTEARDAAPGTLLGGGRVACGDGSLELVEVQAAGRKAVRGVDWMNGARVQAGERLG